MAKARLFRVYRSIIDDPIHDKVKQKTIGGNTIITVMK